MDELKKNEVKSSVNKLIDIDAELQKAYPDTGKVKLSDDESLKIVQKAVLYHRIRQDEALRQGKQSPENDEKYNKLISDIAEGKDPVAEYVKEQTNAQRAELLKELTDSDTHEAHFEKLITIAAKKKTEAEASAPDQKKGDVPQTTAEKIKTQTDMLKSSTMRSIVDNMEKSPKEFLAMPENQTAMRRLMAMELYKNQVEYEDNELRDVYRFESPEKREEMVRSRGKYSFEKEATADFEKYFTNLQYATEINIAMNRLAQCKNLDELSNFVLDPPSPGHLYTHENLKLCEDKMVVDAIRNYMASSNAPEAESELEKKLQEILEKKQQGFPPAPKPEDYENCGKDYDALIKLLKDKDDEDSKSLTDILNEEKKRMEDMQLAERRESLKIAYRSDVLIDYIDPNDPEQRPMDALEARELLIRGVELKKNVFYDNEFIGDEITIRYDEETGLIKEGPDKMITRVIDLSEKTGPKPELQLDELKKMKQILDKTDGLITRNSESYNKTMESLEKVIKAQEAMSPDANVRQVAELRKLYAELDENAAKYTKEEPEKFRGNTNGKLRMDAMNTLRSITGEEFVQQTAAKLYTEQKKLDEQQKRLEPCKKIMDNWKNPPATPEEREKFKKDYEALADRVEQLKKDYGEMPYFQMGIAERLENFNSMADDVQKDLDAEKKIDPNKLEAMKEFSKDSNLKLKDLYAMDPIGKKQKTEEKKKENPEKEKEVKKKEKTSAVK